MTKIPRFKVLLTFFFMAILNLSCRDSDDLIIPAEEIIIPTGIQDTLLYFTSIFDGMEVPVKIVFPQNAQHPLPAVVVLHGSGGNWKKGDDENGDGIPDVAFIGELSSQNSNWATWLNENGYIAAFPDSFNPRGVVEAHGPADEYPKKLTINAQGPRSSDAVQTHELLLKLRDENGNPLVREGDVGVTGFSDGGTTVYSAVYDHPTATPSGYEWLYDGEYVVPEPLNIDEHPKFAAAVSKYGGGSHHGFYGSVNDCSENIYRPYCPLRVELGEEDGLTENNLKLITCMEEKGVSDLEYHVYAGAPHGFDHKDDVNGPLSREHTIAFFDRYLKD